MSKVPDLPEAIASFVRASVPGFVQILDEQSKGWWTESESQDKAWRTTIRLALAYGATYEELERELGTPPVKLDNWLANGPLPSPLTRRLMIAGIAHLLREKFELPTS